MPWTDHSKPETRPGPWDAPEAPKVGAASPDPRPDAPARREESKAAQQRRDPRREPPATRPRGPHLRELGQDLQRRFIEAAVSPARRRIRLSLLATVGLIAVTGWLALGVRMIEPGEAGVVTRFGAFTGVLAPGLHYRAPPPVDRVRRIQTSATNELSFGTGGDLDGVSTLTRDGAPVTLALVAQWRVVDPVRYVFATPKPIDVIRSAVESAVSKAVGRRSTTELVDADAAISAEVASRLQDRLDRQGVGVSISGVQIRGVSPPEPAQGALRELAAAKADAATARRDSELYRGRVLADARGEAAAALQQAQAVADREVAEAKGEAARFTLLDQAYRKAPDVTRDRLYTEAMARVLHDTNKVVVSASGGALAALPAELFRKPIRQAGSAEAAAQASGTPP